ncbi:unnamed protein product [Cylindrotheca closterium]|uniref:PPC domain-containing protein n=1 Tax=Cylindrotheca closterium TaxID=2856 RepID=A0AAD2G358_9STRA|nr:unnamed protein product [Cylindrotheca closterium]
MAQSTPYGAVVAHPIRLKPGEDFVSAIENAASQAMSISSSSSAFVMTAVGSLDKVSLRMANASRSDGGNTLPSNEIRNWNERMEVVSLVGTLSSSGKHLHMSLSDKNGTVVGGHVMSGQVFTTMEIVLGTIKGVVFKREVDEATGYRELVVEKKESIHQT